MYTVECLFQKLAAILYRASKKDLFDPRKVQEILGLTLTEACPDSLTGSKSIGFHLN